MREWLNYMESDNNSSVMFKPLRATVLGMAGSGKSHLIRVIVQCIKYMFGRNDCVFVGAPTGVAASNVGGETIHSLFSISPKRDDYRMKKETENKMKQKLANVVVLLIDERSMLGNVNLAFAEANCRKTAYKGFNNDQEWGGVPVVIMIGDDYQLPPVKATGVIKGYHVNGLFNKRHNIDRERMEVHGYKTFMNLTEKCYVMTKNFRQSGKEAKLTSLLRMLRTGQVTKAGAKELMKYHISNPDMHYTEDEINKITKDVTYLCATHEEKNKKNYMNLYKIHSAETPVALIKTKWMRSDGVNSKIVKSHFDRDDIKQMETIAICVGAQVSIARWNFDPSLGLYNHAFGKVVSIYFDEGKNPNNGDHPEFVEVEIPGFNLPSNMIPWNNNNHKVMNKEKSYFWALFFLTHYSGCLNVK